MRWNVRRRQRRNALVREYNVKENAGNAEQNTGATVNRG